MAIVPEGVGVARVPEGVGVAFVRDCHVPKHVQVQNLLVTSKIRPHAIFITILYLFLNRAIIKFTTYNIRERVVILIWGCGIS